MGRRVSEPLTNERCKTATAPPKGNKLFRCCSTPGLALRVTAAGHRSFVFCYSAPDNRERRLTIGDFGPWTLASARQRIKDLRQELDRGIDPLGTREAQRTAPSLRDLWEWYTRTAMKALSPRSQQDITRSWQRHIAPELGQHTKVRNLRPADIRRLVARVTTMSGATAANRCHSYIRRILNLALVEEMVETNVAKSVPRHQEHARQRYLSGTELKRLSAVLEARKSSPAAKAIKLLLLTGARRSEVLGMRWAEIDFESGSWTKPPSRTKQRRIHRVPLTPTAIDLLSTLRSAPESEFVFPSTGGSGHLTDVKKQWAVICAEAGIYNCRIHDLRHSFASVLASGGVSLAIIGGLLGHSQASTTSRYAHLYDEPLRAAADLVSQAMQG